MKFVVEDGVIEVTFPFTEIVMAGGGLFLIIFFGVLSAVIVSRGII